MTRRPRLRLVLVLALTAPLASMRDAAATTDPPLASDPAALDAAVHCPPPAHLAADPVLLVHGTATNSAESWDWGLAPALRTTGRDVCTVDIPGRSMGDIQVSTEFVVHAIRSIAATWSRQVAVVGHSQGGLEPRWALRWWPSVRAQVSDLVLLATPNHGARSADGACAFGRCAEAVWQMKTGSAFVTALNRDDETPGDVDYTSIYSLTDELVQPAAFPSATAAIDGASNVLLQDVCPGRPVHHAGFLHDEVVRRLILDALTHVGGADPARLPVGSCQTTWIDGTDPVAGNAALYGNAFRTFGASYPGASREPALAAYASS